MQIEIFALCDAATADFGKLNMLGVFDAIWGSQFPVVHPQCYIAIRVRFEKIEAGQHLVAINFIDMDGRSIIPQQQGVLTVNFPEGERTISANLIFGIQGLKLDRVGEYSIDLAIDGQQKSSLPLFVKERK